MIFRLSPRRIIIFTISLTIVMFVLRRQSDSQFEDEFYGIESGDVIMRQKRMAGGPCNLEAYEDDPKKLVAVYRNCRDDLRTIMEKNLPVPSAFEETDEGRLMVERVRRLVNVKQKCNNRKVASMPMIDSWIRVSKPHELAYCQLEKTGSSTMLTFLMEINNMETLYPRNDDLHQTSLDNFKVIGQEAVDMAEKYFDIVQVRHPFTRLVSCYCDKILGERPPFLKKFTEFRSHRNQTAEDMVREQLPSYRFLSDAKKGTKTDQWRFQFFLKIIPAPGKEEYLARESRIEDPEPLGDTPTFRDFVMEVAYQILRCGDNQDCRKEINASYGRQIDKCDPCSWNFDLLMKLETIDEDFPLLRKLLGHNKPKAVDDSGSSSTNEERVVHRKISACRSYDEYMRQLNSEELDLIYTAYYEDFEVFGYEPFNL